MTQASGAAPDSTGGYGYDPYGGYATSEAEDSRYGYSSYTPAPDSNAALRAAGFTQETIDHYGIDKLKGFLTCPEELAEITKELNTAARNINDGSFAAGEKTVARSLSFTTSFIPVVGQIKDAHAAYTGTDWISGDELAPWERGLAGAAVAASVAKPLVTGAKPAATGLLSKLDDAAGAFSDFLDEAVEGIGDVFRVKPTMATAGGPPLPVSAWDEAIEAARETRFLSSAQGTGSAVTPGASARAAQVPTPPIPDGTIAHTSDILTEADAWLGPGYTEPEPSVFRSVPDSDGVFKQVRMTDSDLTTVGNHGGAPHVNFEVWAPKPNRPGRMTQEANHHVFLKD